MYSLRKLIWMAYAAVGSVLALMILVGIRQYVLSDQYNSIIDQSEKAIFHFATIRETITESLIDDRWQRLESVIPELEKLNSELVRLQESTLIPSEFKLALVDKVDLAGIIITVRKLIHGDGDIRQSKALQEQMRAIADHLLQYDRIIASQVRGRFLNFQMTVIGAMGLIISLAGFALNRLYRNTVVPLLKLSRQLQTEGRLDGDLEYGPEVSQEIAEVIDGVKALSKIGAGEGKGGGGAEQQLLAECVNETANRLNGIINYAQLLADDETSAMSGDERALLQKIVDNGTSLAETWKKAL